MSKTARAAVATAATLGFAVASLPAQAADLTAVTLPDYKPFSGPDLPGKGLCNDAATRVFKEAGHNVTVELMPWSRAVRSVNEGDADILTCVWQSSDPDEEFLNFPDTPIAENRIVFMKPADSDFTYNDLSDLEGMTVGTVQDYGYNEDFQNAEHFEKQVAGSLLNNIRKLVRGRIDLAVGDELVMRYNVSQNLSDQADQVAYTDGAMSVNELFVAPGRATDNHQQLADQFDEAIQALRDNGTWSEMLAEHGLGS